MMDKAGLRLKMLSLRKSMNYADFCEYSSVIQNIAKEEIIKKNYDIILSYADFGGEVKTGAVNEFVLSSGKELYLPKVISKSESVMEFYRVSNLNGLKSGSYGIYEPSENNDVFLYAKEKDKKILMIVPGVSFDHRGYRLGYGKGYYDRYLYGKDNIIKMAFSFAYQIADVIDVNETDIKMDVILTEKGQFKE